MHRHPVQDLVIGSCGSDSERHGSKRLALQLVGRILGLGSRQLVFLTSGLWITARASMRHTIIPRELSSCQSLGTLVVWSTESTLRICRSLEACSPTWTSSHTSHWLVDSTRKLHCRKCSGGIEAFRWASDLAGIVPPITNAEISAM